MSKDKNSINVIQGVFISLLTMYVLFLVFIPLLDSYNPEFTPDKNVVPFKTIFEYFINSESYNTDIIIYNIFGNILLFLPFALFIGLAFRKNISAKNLFFTSILTAFFIEIFHREMFNGIFDIDDIILRVFGAFIGWLIFSKIQKKYNILKLY